MHDDHGNDVSDLACCLANPRGGEGGEDDSSESSESARSEELPRWGELGFSFSDSSFPALFAAGTSFR